MCNRRKKPRTLAENREKNYFLWERGSSSVFIIFWLWYVPRGGILDIYKSSARHYSISP